MERQRHPRARYDKRRERNLALHCNLFGIFKKADLIQKKIRQRTKSANPKSENDGRETQGCSEEKTNRESKLSIAQTHSPPERKEPNGSKKSEQNRPREPVQERIRNKE